MKRLESREFKHPPKGEGCHSGTIRTLAEEMESIKKNEPWNQPGGKKLQRKTLKANTSNTYFFMLLHEKLNSEEEHVWEYILNHFCKRESLALN